MRSRVKALLAATAALGLAGTAGYAIATAGPAQAAASDPYTWKNVEVHGGGFVDGIVYNKSQANLVYARTDIGGAYRWNPSTGRWLPLQDFTAPGDWNSLGVESLATDPVEVNRLLLVVGEYTASYGSNAAVLRSTDQGATFQRTDLSFKAGANENGRNMGERLGIDPNQDSIVYMGTRNNGLWRSTDYGATWSAVASFPVLGQSGLGVAWVEFDKSSGSSGHASQRIYVGVADSATPVYRSTDGGATWSAVPGQPSAGLPQHGKLTADDGTLYVSYGDAPGPYSMYNGAVYKYSVAGGTWTNITPLVPYTNGEAGFGYAGLAVDAQNPGTVMVATMSRWGPVDDIFRSTNGGTSWTSITAHSTMDVSAAPYLAWHGTPKLGWMIGSLEIDPFNSDKFLYGTGATVFGGDSLTTVDSGGSITISSRAFGLEETAVQDLISPPSGPPLISALGDIGVFRHDSLGQVPAGGMADNPVFGTSTSLDYAETAPSIVYRAGYMTPPAVGLAYSTDGGSTWAPVATMPENPDGAGNVAVSSDGATVLWSPDQRGVYYSTNRGTTWTASTGISASSVAIRADRVNPSTFYAVVNGTFYVSTDQGASFTARATGLPTGSTYFKAVPGVAGDIWLTTGYGGLYHSTDGGTTFTHLTNVTEAYTVGFGQAAPGQSYLAVYLNGIVDGVNGLFRSDDGGATWVRINDDAHQWGWIGKAITGDPRVYGRVYVSTNGRGIIYGERAGTGDTTAPSTPGAPTASSIGPNSVVLAWSASTDNVGVTGYDILNAGNAIVASATGTSVTVTGLTANTAYALRVRAKDGAGNLSAASTAVTFTTAAADTSAPTTPGTPTVSAVTSSSATLAWPAATDNIGVSGYDVLDAANAVVATSTTTSATVTGLIPSTAYALRVRARDAAGNTSAASAAVTFTTAAPPAGACTVGYSVTSQWAGGFQANVVITNTGTAAINGWTLSFTFPNGQVISQLWGGAATQSGASVSVANASYTGSIPAGGGNTSFGFLASWNNSTNGVPTSFVLNGAACTAG